jgi:hypothetical protein
VYQEYGGLSPPSPHRDLEDFLLFHYTMTDPGRKSSIF